MAACAATALILVSAQDVNVGDDQFCAVISPVMANTKRDIKSDFLHLSSDLQSVLQHCHFRFRRLGLVARELFSVTASGLSDRNSAAKDAEAVPKWGELPQPSSKTATYARNGANDQIGTTVAQVGEKSHLDGGGSQMAHSSRFS